MKKILTTSLALAALLAAASVASAANLQLSSNLAQNFDSTLATKGSGAAGIQPGTYELVDIRASLSNLAAGENFWTALFNVTVVPKNGAPANGLTATDLGTGMWLSPAAASSNGLYDWRTPASPAPALQSYAQYDSNGASLGGTVAHWQNGNADLGSSVNDLNVIGVEATAAEANNRRYGEASRPSAGYGDQLGGPTLLGSVLFQGVTAGSYDIVLTPIAGSPWGIYTGNAAGAGTTSAQPAASMSFVAATITVVPEPASMVMLAMGGIALVGAGLRRRAR